MRECESVRESERESVRECERERVREAGLAWRDRHEMGLSSTMCESVWVRE